MQTFTRKKKYKARTPEETMAIIKGILSECGITVSLEERSFDQPGVHSCRVWLSEGDLEYGDFGTNGKGMTRSYSLASAYAELMERLQNFILFGDYAEDAHSKGLTKYMVAPDEVKKNAEASWREVSKVLAPLLRINEMPEMFPVDAEMPSVPYADMLNGGCINLPHKTLRMVTGSNGMCAGNNYMEAVTQGVSEIYERAAVREAYRDDPKIRQLHLESFAGNEIHDRLEKMKSAGYGVKILDLSMGKDYPVVGLLLEKDGRKAFRAGADPCPVTALERCLTESFQGDPGTVERFFKSECCRPFPGADRMTKYMINEEELAYHVDGSGKAAYCIFNPSEEYNENYKGTDADSEQSDYEYLIALTRRLGLDLYIRDWSFLGFPAYHCIIPQLSNYDLIYEEGGEVYSWSFEKTVFRNDHFTKPIAEILNRMFDKYERSLPVQGNLIITGN